MPGRTWSRVKDLLPLVLAHATGRRREAARVLAGHDTRVHRELQSLLAAHDDGPGTLAPLPPAFAQAALAQGPFEPAPFRPDEAGMDTAPPAAPGQARTPRALPGSCVGRRLGPWHVEALLASGGMGDVYLARRDDGQFDTRVALKCMRGIFNAQVLQSRFDNERRILSSLDHPNLARLIDGGISEEGLPYFVMEYVDGEPLDTYCRRLRAPLAERLRLFMALCRVVHHIHGRGVVHRDLKFSNILVTRDGAVKLVDFGIAKRLQAEDTEPATQTATALRPLTLAFASPEQVAGREITAASDIYSLGVVLYGLLAGTGPYRQVAAHNGYALARAICEQEPMPPSRAAGLDRAARRQLRGDLDAVVLMALRKQPEHRYATALALADDLARHLQHHPVQARRGALAYRTGRWLRRHQGLVASALIAGCLLTLALGGAWRAEQQGRQAAQNVARLRELARTMVFDVSGAIERLPGTTAARKLAMEQGLAQLRQLAAESADDPELNLEIATAYYRLGEGQGRFGDYTAGNGADADRSFAAAQALLEPLLHRLPPGSPLLKKAQYQLAVVLGRRQTVLMEEFGDRTVAAALLDRKLQLARQLAAADPAPLYQHLLANAHNELGWLHDHEPAVFRAETDRALSSLDDLLRHAPADKGANSILANVLLARGMHELAYQPGTAGARAAAPFLRRSLARYQALAARYANEAEYILMLAEVENGLGSMLQAQGDGASAIDHHRRALGHLDRLSAMEPGNVVYRIDQAAKQASLGHTLREQGDLKGALAAAHTAIEVLEGIDPQHAQAWGVVRSHVHSHYEMALALEAAHGPGARQACTHWRDVQRALPAFLRRAGGLVGDLSPAQVEAAAQACAAAAGPAPSAAAAQRRT